jgi:hypothetical protein
MDNQKTQPQSRERRPNKTKNILKAKKISNTDITKNQRWTQVLVKFKQFLFFYKTPAVLLIDKSGKSLVVDEEICLWCLLYLQQ